MAERKRCRHSRRRAICDSSAGRLLPLFVIERETGRRIITRKWSRAIEAHIRACAICWFDEITLRIDAAELETEYLDQDADVGA